MARECLRPASSAITVAMSKAAGGLLWRACEHGKAIAYGHALGGGR